VSSWSRLLLLVRSVIGRLLDEVEDPREALDLAYSEQLSLQARMRRAMADVVTARKRLELQARQVARTAQRLEEQARRALEQGRPDAARDALTRRAVMRAELDELDRQAAALLPEEARLSEAAKRLDLQLQRTRIRLEAARAVHGAARARAELGAAMTGLSARDADALAALQRAEERVADTRDRATALERLMSRGALDARPLTDPVWRALQAHDTDTEVAAELARIEEELLWGPGSGDPGRGRTPDQPDR